MARPCADLDGLQGYPDRPRRSARARTACRPCALRHGWLRLLRPQGRTERALSPGLPVCRRTEPRPTVRRRTAGRDRRAPEGNGHRTVRSERIPPPRPPTGAVEFLFRARGRTPRRPERRGACRLRRRILFGPAALRPNGFTNLADPRHRRCRRPDTQGQPQRRVPVHGRHLRRPPTRSAIRPISRGAC